MKMDVTKTKPMLVSAILCALSLSFSPLLVAEEDTGDSADYQNVGSDSSSSFILGTLELGNGSTLIVNSGNMDKGAGHGYTSNGREIPAYNPRDHGAFQFTSNALTVDDLTISDDGLLGSNVELTESTVVDVSGTVIVEEDASLVSSSGVDSQIDSLINNGTVNISAGRLNIVDSVINNNSLEIVSGAEISNAGIRMNSYIQNSGTTTVNGTLRAETVLVEGGTLKGSGLIDGNVIVSGGVVAPGNSPGTLTIAGDFTLNSGGTLLLEVGDDPDLLGDYLWDILIADSYTLNGGEVEFNLFDTVDIDIFTSNFFIDDFLRVGDAETNLGYLESGLLLDSFDNINFSAYDILNAQWYDLTLDAGGSFTAVSAVPVPAAVWLFGSGLLALISIGRRKHNA